MTAVGASRGDFVKYPRTPHLFGSRGTADDKHLGQHSSLAFLADASLVVEEKVDGTNVGVHFTPAGRMVLQGRGREIVGGMHAQYGPFQRWAAAERPALEMLLGDRLLLFGEWLYARHSLHYRRLPHYFVALDIYDKQTRGFLDRAARLDRLAGTGLPTVPLVHRGPVAADKLAALIGPSHFGGQFENPLTGRPDNLMEGLYLRTEAEGRVTGRAKFVRPEFVETVKRGGRQRPVVVPNRLADGTAIGP